MAVIINDLTDGGAPKVELRLTGLPSEVVRVTGYRISGVVEQRVSGIINAPVTGAGSWVDFEVPAQASTYRFEMFNAAGESLGFTDTADIELGYDGCWMHNPLAPTGAVKVSLAGSAAQRLARPVPGGIVRPKGRRVGVILAEPRGGLQGLVLDVRAEDLITADKVQALIDSTPVICVRFGMDHSGVRIRSPLFLGVFDIPEEGWDVFWGGENTMQRIQGDEVARPAPGVFVPLLRRKDVNAYYATRAAMNSAYISRLDANADYTLAGYAGD